MSTVHEAIAAHALGAEVLGLSLVTNAAAGSDAEPHAAHIDPIDHLDVLADLVERGGDEVRIAVGGGVRPANVAHIVAETGAREVHLRAPGTVVPAGSSAGYDDASRSVTSAEVLADVMAALGR